MALQFPASASIGQTYQSGSSPIYTYNGNVWALSSGNTGIAQLNAYTASLKTALQTTGSTATILGNLNVQGTQTALNQASLQITDKFIRVASGSLSSAQSDGAGIRIDGANVTMSWDSSNSQLTFNTQISASRFVGDGSGLTGVTSYTNSDNLAYLNSKGVISGSSQVIGILSSLNTYTGSNDTKWSTIQNVTSSLISATGSYETKGRGIVSGSSQLTSSYDVRYEITGRNIISGSSQLTASYDTRYAPSASYITSINGAISSSTQITNGSGIVSGSSQLTSSYDGRYIQTGSYNLYTASINSYTSSNDTTNTTQNSRLTALENKTGSLATTGSNTFNGTETISGSLLLSGSFSYNGTPLQNGFAFAQPRVTTILSNSSYTGGTSWVGAYTASGGAVIVTANYTGYRSTAGTGYATLFRDNIAVPSTNTSFYFNQANVHMPLPPIVYALNSETGSHTYSIGFTNITADTNDYLTINVLEYGNSAMFPTTLISGSTQLTSSLDTRYLTIGGNNIFSSSAQLPSGLVSGSSQLTSSYDTRYTLSGSVGATPAGTISGSSQLTASFDTRYALSGSGGSATIPAGTVSGSSQLTASYDGRYLQTGSFNSYTASINTYTSSINLWTSSIATTGSNNFNGNQSITGSLTISTGSFVGSQITANTSSLYLTSGSNLYLQNNGLAELTGSLVLSGSSTFRGTETIVGSLVITGSTQLTGSISIQSGSITMPNRPAFRVIGVSSTNIATPSVLSGSLVSVDYNEGGYYNTTNGKFTAPIAGLYHVFYNGRVGGTNASMQVIVYKNTNISSLMWESVSNTSASHFGVSGILKLAVNDTLEVKVTVGQIQFDANDNWGVAYIG